MVEKLTSYADVAGATVVNEVAFKYNGFRQLIADSQAHDGAVEI
jgi:hypothetical protein